MTRSQETGNGAMNKGEEMPRAGGWGWLLLPTLLMFAGLNLVFGLFALRLGDPAAATSASLAVGPVTWSFLQLVLLWIAVSRLRASSVSVRELIGFDRQRLLSDVGLGIVVAAACVAVILVSLWLVEPVFGGGEPPFAPWAMIWWLLVTSITAAVGEEVYFRGFLFDRLGRLSRPTLLLVTSLAFAVWHLSPVMLLHTFLVGLGLGWVYLATRRLLPVMLGHWLTDVVGGFWLLGSW